MSINKMWVLACTLCLALPATSYSQVLLYDGFSGTDYSAGPAAGVPYGGIGSGYATGGAWNNNEFAEGGLEWSDANGVPLKTTAGVHVVRTDADMEANLDTSSGGIFDAVGLVDNEAIGGPNVSGTLYYSFLGREIDGNGNGWAGFNLWNNAGGGDEHLGVGNGGGPDDYVSFHHDSGEPPITDPPVPIDGDVHLFVVRGDYASGPDAYTVWLDPDLLAGEAGQSPDISDMVGTRGEDGDGFNQFRMRGSEGWDFDEVRFGMTWDDVTPIPEPSTCLLMIAGISAVVMQLRRRRIR